MTQAGTNAPSSARDESAIGGAAIARISRGVYAAETAASLIPSTLPRAIAFVRDHPKRPHMNTSWAGVTFGRSAEAADSRCGDGEGDASCFIGGGEGDDSRFTATNCVVFARLPLAVSRTALAVTRQEVMPRMRLACAMSIIGSRGSEVEYNASHTAPSRDPGSCGHTTGPRGAALALALMNMAVTVCTQSYSSWLSGTVHVL